MSSFVSASGIVVVAVFLVLLVLREVLRAYLSAAGTTRLQMLDVAVRSLMVAFVFIIGTRAAELLQ